MLNHAAPDHAANSPDALRHRMRHSAAHVMLGTRFSGSTALEEPGMLRKSEPLTVSLSSEIAEQDDKVAVEQEWQSVYRYGEQAAGSQGLQPQDVSRVVSEYRDERPGDTA